MRSPKEKKSSFLAEPSPGPLFSPFPLPFWSSKSPQKLQHLGFFWYLSSNFPKFLLLIYSKRYFKVSQVKGLWSVPLHRMDIWCQSTLWYYETWGSQLAEQFDFDSGFQRCCFIIAWLQRFQEWDKVVHPEGSAWQSKLLSSRPGNEKERRILVLLSRSIPSQLLIFL